MERHKKGVTTIDDYIEAYPREVQNKLKGLREAIKTVAPGADEQISYGMPAFRFKGILVYFAAFEKHIGFYPTASGIRAFQKEIAGYKNSKGAVQFPIDRPLPLVLIKKIVKYRVAENIKKAG